MSTINKQNTPDNEPYNKDPKVVKNTAIANIIQCLSENPNGITKEEIERLQDLRFKHTKVIITKSETGWTRSKPSGEEFTNYFYELINKAKTVKDISALMKIVYPLGDSMSSDWLNIFEQIEEEEINIGKNIIQAAASILTNYHNHDLVKFYERLLDCRNKSNKEVYPEFYTKMLETLARQLQKLEKEVCSYDMDIMYYTSALRAFLEKIPSNSSFKEPYQKLMEAIHSVETSFIEKKYQSDLEDQKIKFQ